MLTLAEERGLTPSPLASALASGLFCSCPSVKVLPARPCSTQAAYAGLPPYHVQLTSLCSSLSCKAKGASAFVIGATPSHVARGDGYSDSEMPFSLFNKNSRAARSPWAQNDWSPAPPWLQRMLFDHITCSFMLCIYLSCCDARHTTRWVPHRHNPIRCGVLAIPRHGADTILAPPVTIHARSR